MLQTTAIDSTPEAPDVVLIRRMADGDEAALAALYDRYAGLVFSVAKRIVGDRSTAEEILQECERWLVQLNAASQVAQDRAADTGMHERIARLRKSLPTTMP